MNDSAAIRREQNQLELALPSPLAHNTTLSQLTPDDRLSLTFCLAFIFHALIVLGIVFIPEDKADPRYEFMEIVLVQQSSEPAEDADLLAQANLRGGGDVSETSIPASPLPPLPQQERTEVTPPADTQPPAAAAEPESPVSTPAEDADKPVLVDTEKTTGAVEESPQEPDTDRPSAVELMTNSLRMATLSSEVQRKLETKEKRPNRTFISASTREYRYAAYMEAWRAKVERVGNLNYPEEARRRNISGQLVLDVALNPDGKINQITIRRSSGYKVLDDAAIRIVELAAPYAPFPDDIRSETDILHITRTWQFLDQRGFR